MSEAPSGWSRLPLEQLVTFSIGGLWGTAPDLAGSDSSTVAVMRGADYRDWAIERAANAAVRSVSAKAVTTRLVRDGDLVVEVSGGGPTQPVGRVVLVDDATLRSTDLPLIVSNFCRRAVLTDHVVAAFVYYQLVHKYLRGDTERFQTATTNIRNLNFGKYLVETEINLAPRREQERIVAAIEEQFSRLDAGVAALERVQKNLKRMKSALLREAVSGRLHAGDEVASDQEGLPTGWVWRPLSEIIHSLRNGIFVSRPGLEPTGVPIFRISAVRPMALNVADVRYVPKAARLKRIEEYFVEPGDLLFTRYSGNPEFVGGCAMVPDGVRQTLHPDKLIRVQVDKNLVEPRFVELAAAAGATRQMIRSRVKTTAGQTGISGSDLRSVLFPVPPLEVQRRIIGEVEDVLLGIERADVIAAAAESHSDRLRSAILTSAFSGSLVHQDPADEPASALVERITTQPISFDGRTQSRMRRARTPQTRTTT